ncbi:hypothetical protein BAC2_00894 [uncultured bacterium]|nr:hypothetical protein BAC2_00894 [uncultured bacterium]
MRYRILCVFVALALCACNLSSSGDREENIATPTTITSGRPVVQILSPQNGAEVVVDDDVLVSANATDAAGVTRVQLLANGQVVKTVSSESPSGDQVFNALLDYTPTSTGTVRLQVIAYRAAIASEPATVEITVRAAQAQVTATTASQPNVPIINPNDPTCRALTNTALRLRGGPGTNYAQIGLLNAGSVVPIIGRIGSNEWWQVRVNLTIGWISAAYTSVYGICNGVPIVTPPATPTPVITNTVVPTSTLTLTAPPPTVTPGPADLLVTNIVGSNVLTLGAGDAPVTSSYSVTITNAGSSPTGQFNNTIAVNPGGAATPLGVVASLAPGESILLNVSLTFSSAGNYTIQAQADSDNQVTELSEVNNAGVFNVTVSAAP